MMSAEGRSGGGAALRAVLARQRARDLLGPAPLDDQVAHSRGFAALVPTVPRRVVDLGSGGGLPGLVLATACWPEAEVALLDGSQRRCTYLELAVAELGLGPRVTVRWGRAEEVGHEPGWRGRADVVVARGFGAPAVTAEGAAPLLAVGGSLVVSEPPGAGGERWDGAGLSRLGLELVEIRQVGGAGYARLRQVVACPPPYPRRPGVPARRPLF